MILYLEYLLNDLLIKQTLTQKESEYRKIKQIDYLIEMFY